MQIPSRPAHICRDAAGIEDGELTAQPFRMRRLNSGFRSGLKEPLQAIVPETQDHAQIVSRIDTFIKKNSTPAHGILYKLTLRALPVRNDFPSCEKAAQLRASGRESGVTVATGA